MQGWKNDNDPWVPLPQANGVPSSLESQDTDNNSLSTAILQSELPPNPLHQLIDSQKYIETLEKKLERLKSKKKEPTSKDIITSLALFQEDQMKRFVNSDTKLSADGDCGLENTCTVTVPSYLMRKLHPEQQALSAEELAELIKSDVVAHVHEEDDLQEGRNSTNTVQLSNLESMSQPHQPNTETCSSENWANFSEMNQEINSDDFSDDKPEESSKKS